MNERLQELAEQAWNATAVSPEFGHPCTFAAKLSELIVQDCIQQISNRWKNDNRIKTEIERREANSCINDIKEHFGV